MKKEIEKIIKNALMAAEMRQGCTDYEPYTKLLYTEILSLFEKFLNEQEDDIWEYLLNNFGMNDGAPYGYCKERAQDIIQSIKNKLKEQ